MRAWQITEKILLRLGIRLRSWGEDRSSRWVEPGERVVKRLLFDCQMCGQCVLHYTGMTCPMTCPKQLRNGPCGGTRLNGTCEVKPEMDCVWLKAVARAPDTPWAEEIHRLNPPVDWRLEGMASWVTFATGRDQITTGSEQTMRYATEAMERP